MESLRSQVDAWIARSGVTAAQIARRAGVSGSTIHRIRAGQTDPSLGTLREVAIACGFDLVLEVAQLSDPLAARAARVLVESGYPGTSDEGVRAWIERLERRASTPVDVLEAAADASNPYVRDGSIHFAGHTTTGMLASAGAATGSQWAISGSVGLTIPERQEPFVGNALLWAEDAALAATLLGNTLRRVPHASIATVTVVQAEPELFHGAFDVASIHYAAPVQIMLDCIAHGGETADAARRLVSTW